MKYNADVFCVQFPIVKRFVYHLVCYRELSQAYNNLSVESVFWTHTIDAHVLQACISWCMVFGSEGLNSTHWKKLNTENSEELKTNFCAGLLAYTSLSQEEWIAYGKEMREFRGGFAAHRNLGFNKPVPNLEIAKDVALFYDTWIRKLIVPDVFEEPPLADSLQLMHENVRPLAWSFISQTKLLEVSIEHLPLPYR